MRKKQSTLAERVLWLRQHPDYLRAPLNEVVNAMRRDGLFAPKTYYRDCQSAIRRAKERCGE